MTLWPQSLFGRTAIIIALSLVIAQTTFLILAHWSFNALHVKQMVSLIETETKTARFADQKLPNPARHAFFQTLRSRGFIRTTHFSRSPNTPPILTAITRTLTRDGYLARAHESVKGERIGVLLKPHEWLSISLPGHLPIAPWPRIGFLIMGALLAGSGAVLLVRRVNRPLAALAAAASAFGRGEKTGPLPLDGPIEVIRVCEAFNRMTEAARRYERDRALLLIGVSHDLRTPLARMRLAIELTPQVDHDLRDGMIQDVEEMDNILGEFLAYARHGVHEMAIPGDLNETIQEIIQRYERQGATIDYEPYATARFPYPPLATTRLLGNFVDNAVRHAGGRIHIRATPIGTFIQVTIRDYGPGLTAAQKETASLSLDLTDGHRRGLGLAIAHRIAETIGAKITLLSPANGGLEAVIQIPTQKI